MTNEAETGLRRFESCAQYACARRARPAAGRIRARFCDIVSQIAPARRLRVGLKIAYVLAPWQNLNCEKVRFIARQPLTRQVREILPSWQL